MTVQNNLSAAKERQMATLVKASQVGMPVTPFEVAEILAPPVQDKALAEARQEWLAQAAESLRPEFEARGLHYPELAFQSVDFDVLGTPHAADCTYLDAEPWLIIPPQKSSACLIRMGERFEDTPIVGGNLIHELIHSCMPMNEGHGPMFGHHARSFGLQGPLNRTVASEATLPIMARAFINSGVGEYPRLLRPVWWGRPKYGDLRPVSDPVKDQIISILTRGM